jgi:hypothetical protein
MNQQQKEPVPEGESQPKRGVAPPPPKSELRQTGSSVVVGSSRRDDYEPMPQRSQAEAQLEVFEVEEDGFVEPAGRQNRLTLNKQAPTRRRPDEGGVRSRQLARLAKPVAEEKRADEMWLGPICLNDLALRVETDARTRSYGLPFVPRQGKALHAIRREPDVVIYQQNEVGGRAF